MRKTTDRWGRHQEAPRLPLTEDVLLGRETLLEVFQVVLPLERLERIAVVDPRAHRPKHERQAAREAPRVVLPARLGVGVGAAAGGVSAAAVGCRQWDADDGMQTVATHLRLNSMVLIAASMELWVKPSAARRCSSLITSSSTLPVSSGLTP